MFDKKRALINTAPPGLSSQQISFYIQTKRKNSQKQVAFQDFL